MICGLQSLHRLGRRKFGRSSRHDDCRFKSRMPWDVAYRTGITTIVKAVPNVSPAMMVTASPAQNTSGSSGNNAE